MAFTYTQHGSVALIHENGRSIATAVLKDGWWSTRTYPNLGHKSPRFYQVPSIQTARTLDDLVAGATLESQEER